MKLVKAIYFEDTDTGIVPIETLYTYKDEDKYLLCNDGSTWFGTWNDIINISVKPENFAVPHFKHEGTEYIMQIDDGDICVYDDNMNIIRMYEV